MFNKILVFGGLSVAAILVIENMVMATSAYVLWFNSQTYVLSIFSTIIGFLIGYGFKGFSSKSYEEERDDLDF